MLSSLITAFRTLSNLPVPGRESQDYASSLHGFAVVGFVLGLILYAEAYGLDFLLGKQWSGGVAVLILITGIWMTRGFHLDGVADFADAFWGGYDRERTLAIMKDTNLGTFGVVALVILLLAKWVALVRLFELSACVWIISSTVISRAMMVDLIVRYPYARSEGVAGPFFKGAKTKHRISAFIVAAVILFLVNGLIGLIVLFAAWILSRIFGMWCMKRVGGITGDLLGTCCELSETFVLFLSVFIELINLSYF